MKTYAVDLARYWKYTVKAKDKNEAEELAYKMFQQDEGKYAQYDDIMITCIDPGEQNAEKHGYWIVGADGSYMCSECKSVFRYEIGDYCSNCGTRLEYEE